VTIAIVDYGAGNTRSVRAACARLGATAEVTADPAALAAADVVILPGVGSARSAMATLRASGAVDALVARVQDGGPTLGICLGLQLALTSSEEDGGVRGLGLMPGVVRPLPDERRPRLGWFDVQPLGASFYFAHSFYADTSAATATADGVPAVAAMGSFTGVQFHPEKSGPAGLDWMAQWLTRA
jgi:imidazole glycerol-phosphate synthase subunit HisH